MALKNTFLLPQLWDCETSGKNIGMYIPGRIKEATKGSLVMNLLQGKSESQVEIARLYWAVNEYSEAMARQGKHSIGTGLDEFLLHIELLYTSLGLDQEAQFMECRCLQ